MGGYYRSEPVVFTTTVNLVEYRHIVNVFNRSIITIIENVKSLKYGTTNKPLQYLKHLSASTVEQRFEALQPLNYDLKRNNR